MLRQRLLHRSERQAAAAVLLDMRVPGLQAGRRSLPLHRYGQLQAPVIIVKAGAVDECNSASSTKTNRLLRCCSLHCVARDTISRQGRRMRDRNGCLTHLGGPFEHSSSRCPLSMPRQQHLCTHHSRTSASCKCEVYRVLTLKHIQACPDFDRLTIKISILNQFVIVKCGTYSEMANFWMRDI